MGSRVRIISVSFSRPHYYDWERPQKGREKVHPFQREVDLYQSLEQFGYLTTYT